MSCARATYRLFEQSLLDAGTRLADTRSEARSSSVTSLGELSDETARFAMTDPTFGVFHALRATGDVEGAAELARHLCDAYGFVLPPLLFSVVLETCSKAGRSEIAMELKCEGFVGDRSMTEEER